MLRKNFYKYITLSILILLISSCKNANIDDQPDENAIKVMPLGASRTAGKRPQHESYRYELWKLSIDNDLSIDFVGTAYDEARYPAYQGLNFVDREHQGKGGWTSGQLLMALPYWLNNIQMPDIVLFGSPGGNDGLQGLPIEQAILNINAIIDTLQARNPHITILIDQPAPPLHKDSLLITRLDTMQQQVLIIANEQSTSSSTVIAVDMFTDFIPDEMLADNVHYNEEGAAFIAGRYLEVLLQILE